MINTVLVEDNLYVQKVLKTMIERDERFRLTATFTDAFEAEKLCAYGNPDAKQSFGTCRRKTH